jgi:predicted nuclease with TOPRIM domain
MREQMEKRVEELDAEYRSGQEMLAQVETRRAELQQTLLRISGALQVLRELLDEPPETVHADRLAS